MAERFNYRRACETFAEAVKRRSGLDGDFLIQSESGVKRCNYRPAGDSWETHISPGCTSWGELYQYMRGLSDGFEGLTHLRGSGE